MPLLWSSTTRAWLAGALLLLSAIGPLPAAWSSDQEDPVGVWPLRPDPEVVRSFDPPANPYAAGHRGVDLAGTAGQQVLAAMPGTVSFAAPLAGRGVVVIDHGATRTTYEPVLAEVARGQSVGSGEVIGTLAVPHSHCFPRACLHWGWREGEVYLDPLRLVELEPIRLLPLWRDGPIGAAQQTRPVRLATRTMRSRPVGSGAGVGLLIGAA